MSIGRRLKNFLSGMGSVLILMPPQKEKQPLRIMTDEEAMKADAEALASDWEAVGKDMWSAIGKFEEERSCKICGGHLGEFDGQVMQHNVEICLGNLQSEVERLQSKVTRLQHYLSKLEGEV